MTAFNLKKVKQEMIEIFQAYVESSEKPSEGLKHRAQKLSADIRHAGPLMLPVMKEISGMLIHIGLQDEGIGIPTREEVKEALDELKRLEV